LIDWKKKKILGFFILLTVVCFSRVRTRGAGELYRVFFRLTFLLPFYIFFYHSAFSTLLVFHTPHFLHFAFSTLRTPHSALRTPHSAFHRTFKKLFEALMSLKYASVRCKTIRQCLLPDSSPVVTSRSRAARVAQHEDDWGRVRPITASENSLGSI